LIERDKLIGEKKRLKKNAVVYKKKKRDYEGARRRLIFIRYEPIEMIILYAGEKSR